ncbi:MAG: hypothetical protein KME26_00420 [Oscillatoria princeps RMCB-10]|nr:hypothetical protein [Oscillatoria princeps RMCB-10]
MAPAGEPAGGNSCGRAGAHRHVLGAGASVLARGSVFGTGETPVLHLLYSHPK